MTRTQYAIPRKRPKRRTVTLWLIGFALFSFVQVWQNIKVDQINRRNAALNQELTRIEDENAVLAAQVEELKNEERIVRIARERLGLVQAPKVSINLTPE